MCQAWNDEQRLLPKWAGRSRESGWSPNDERKLEHDADLEVCRVVRANLAQHVPRPQNLHSKQRLSKSCKGSETRKQARHVGAKIYQLRQDTMLSKATLPGCRSQFQRLSGRPLAVILPQHQVQNTRAGFKYALGIQSQMQGDLPLREDPRHRLSVVCTIGTRCSGRKGQNCKTNKAQDIRMLKMISCSSCGSISDPKD